jgi:hypothetical protein
MICTHQYNSGDQIKKNYMGGACSTCGKIGDLHKGFWWEDMRERCHMEDLGVDGRIILKWTFKKWYGGHELDCCGSG